MQAVAIRQPVRERTAPDLRTSSLSLRVKGQAMTKEAKLKGFTPFVLRGHQEDELNNGDPPDLMLWGEE